MKTAKDIKKALGHYAKYEALLDPINDEISELLEDYGAHAFMQTDGFCIAWGEGMNNTPVSAVEVEALLEMDKLSALEFLGNGQI